MRLGLHSLEVELGFEGIAPALIEAIAAYFTSTTRPATRPDLSIRLVRTEEVSPPGGEPAFFHGLIRGFTRPSSVLLSDGYSLMSLDLESGSIAGQIHPASEQVPDRLVHVLFFVSLAIAVRKHGLFHLHAGAVVHSSGRGVLVVGDAGSGKTTTTLALVREGWSYLGDDAVWLNAQGSEVIALRIPRPFHVAGVTASFFSEMAGALGASAVEGAKRSLEPEGVFSARALERMEAPSLILLPSVLPDRPSSLEERAPTEAFETLLRSSALLVVNGLPGQRENLALLGALLGQANTVSLRLGSDLREDPRVVSRLVEGILG